ncbi:hypothetical protein ACOACQ_06200, partial [Nocardioides sp. CPCC 206347]|uniref:hypothetical protein n=1 Tax=Nocardioides sp. CPCC 206347 TaxID=3406463 RepID=UPI003B436181
MRANLASAGVGTDHSLRAAPVVAWPARRPSLTTTRGATVLGRRPVDDLGGISIDVVDVAAVGLSVGPGWAPNAWVLCAA